MLFIFIYDATGDEIIPNSSSLPAWDSKGKLFVVIILCVYIFIGLYNDRIFANTKPDSDFDFYESALRKALLKNDPYDIREIGPAFIYPPPALFVIEALDFLARRFNKTSSFFLTINIILLSIMMRQTGAYFGYSLSDIWFWFPLAFFFAPFLATSRLGQINLITEFGIFLFFVSALPLLLAFGLVLAVITKVTPIAFLVYSLVRKDIRTILLSSIVLVITVIASTLRYGYEPNLTYFDVFTQLLSMFPISQNSQSFVSKVWMVFALPVSPFLFQRIFVLYLGVLILSSSILSIRTRDAIPVFIVLGLSITVAPNVMWYHHYVFLLLPLFVWMAWQKLEQRLSLWIITGLLIVQIDYYFLTTGLVIHLFVHISILRVIYQQVRQLQAGQAPLTG